MKLAGIAIVFMSCVARPADGCEPARCLEEQAAPASVSQEDARANNLVGVWTRRAAGAIEAFLLDPDRSYVRMYLSDQGLDCDQGSWRIEPDGLLMEPDGRATEQRDPRRGYLPLRFDEASQIVGFERGKWQTLAERDEWKKSLLRRGCLSRPSAEGARDAGRSLAEILADPDLKGVKE